MNTYSILRSTRKLLFRPIGSRLARQAASGQGVLLILLMLLSGCGGGPDAATPTPVLWGMARDEAMTLYEIVPAESEARFLIGEILRGEPKTVVGKTNQLSGEFAVDLSSPESAAVGPIQVNARTLVTDNDFRNRAIETRILLSRVFEFITFVPTSISGLPETPARGQPVNFQIAGDLTIVETTRPVVFEATAVAVSDTRIEGSATAIIQRADFDLFVPSATGVAGVAEEVILEIDFVAEAAE
jgi:polyisoprenoid-binding protein YceI